MPVRSAEMAAHVRNVSSSQFGSYGHPNGLALPGRADDTWHGPNSSHEPASCRVIQLLRRRLTRPQEFGLSARAARLPIDRRLQFVALGDHPLSIPFGIYPRPDTFLGGARELALEAVVVIVGPEPNVRLEHLERVERPAIVV